MLKLNEFNMSKFWRYKAKEYRVDAKRMTKFDSNQYRKQSLGMFAGTTEEVNLEFHSTLIDVIFDKFSENININRIGDTYRSTVKVIPSQRFYGFILGLGNGIKISAPKVVKHLSRALMHTFECSLKKDMSKLILLKLRVKQIQ